MLDAAAELLLETRSLTFTLAEVGVRAGYSRGLPGQAFGSKAGLVSELVQHLLDRTDETTWPHTLRGEGLAAVLATVRLVFDAPELHARLSIATQVLLLEGTRPNSPYQAVVSRLNRSTTGYLAKQVRIAIERGEVRPDVDAKAQGILIHGAVRGALLQHWLDPTRIPLADLRDELLRIIERNLTPPAVAPD